MYRQLDRTGPSLSQEDIAALERRLGCPLPLDYAAFLLRHNGGSPTPETVPVQNWPAGGTHADVHSLHHLGPNPADDTYDLRWALDCYLGRIPQGLLPIGDNGCGDQFCMWLIGEERGAVVLWDHDAEHCPATHANLHHVAPTFTAFLELFADPPDDWSLPQAVVTR